MQPIMMVRPKPSSSPDQYLSKLQVAELLQIDTRTVDRHRCDKKLKFPLPSIMPGGETRWRRGEIIAWMDSRRQKLR